MIFGRGGGGGVVNRVLKEADGTTVRDVTAQFGSFDNRRFTVDLGQAISENAAYRINGVYEYSNSYRDFVNLERYGVNPTVMIRPDNSTTVWLSYEYFHDRRVTDRGIPSQQRAGVIPGPATPLFPYETSVSTFFGNPNLNYALVDANIFTGVIEHEFDNGLKVRNASRYADYNKFYQNVFPGGAVNAAGTSVNLSAYNNETDRTNLFNQTDFTYKLNLGVVKHTILAGFEFGNQSGLSFRQTGLFNGTSASLPVSPLNPTTYVPVTFRNNGTTDANSTNNLNLAAVYVQDQMEITRYVQLIGGVRFDRFDLTAINRNNSTTQSRVDDLVSPRGGIVIKPVENFAIYGSYSVSYLPSAGDQFSTLTPGLVIAQPEKFVNKEVGVKWDISPRLMFTSAVYELDRTNQRLADPNNPGFFILSGETLTKGFEAGLTGYVTDKWQVAGGYAYTDARIVGATSTTIVPGNRVGLVPYNVFTLWNKYEFHPMFAAGVGVINQSYAYASSDNTVQLPGFTRVDAAIFGKFAFDGRKYRWQVNVENVFNQKYYSTADGNNNITPGSPTAVRGTVTASF